MARGGRGGRSHGHRSHGIGHRHHHGIGHRHRGFGGRHRFGRFGHRRRLGYRRHYGSGRDAIAEFEQTLDRIAMSTVPSFLLNGMLTIAGSHTTAMTHLDAFDINTAQNYQQTPQMNQMMYQLQQVDAFPENFYGKDPEE